MLWDNLCFNSFVCFSSIWLDRHVYGSSGLGHWGTSVFLQKIWSTSPHDSLHLFCILYHKSNMFLINLNFRLLVNEVSENREIKARNIHTIFYVYDFQNNAQAKACAWILKWFRIKSCSHSEQLYAELPDSRWLQKKNKLCWKTGCSFDVHCTFYHHLSTKYKHTL